MGRKPLNKKAVARVLDVSERTVQRLVQRRMLVRPVRMGGSLKWFDADVRAYVYLLKRWFFRNWPIAEPGQERTAKPKGRTE